MIVTMRAVLVTVLVLAHIFTEHFLAFFAREDHFHGLFEGVGFLFGVAFGAVEPLLAAGGADRDLRVENVFAGGGVSVVAFVWEGCVDYHMMSVVLMCPLSMVLSEFNIRVVVRGS